MTYEPDPGAIYVTQREAMRLTGRSRTWTDGLPVAARGRGGLLLYRLADVLAAAAAARAAVMA